MKTISIALFTTVATFAACKKSENKGAPAAKATETAPAAPAGAAPAAAPVAPSAAPAAAGAELDLSPAGEGWKGFTIKAPAGATATSDGTDGVIVNLESLAFQISTQTDVKMLKDGMKAGMEQSKGKVTFTVDKADELAYTTEQDMGGNIIKGYGFQLVLSPGGKKVMCGANVDSEAQVATIKAICNSLTKK
jgi:hypothetical protein